VASIGDAVSRAFPAGFALPTAMPDDFFMVLSYGVTLRNVLDTASGMFTKDLISGRMGTITTTLSLTSEELTAVYTDLRTIDIGDYAGAYHPQDTSGWVHTPSESYYLHVHAAGQEKEISWDDNDDSTAPDAVALRDLFKKIRAMIETKQEYQDLPPVKGGYA
jgi:hypothetical protein